MRSSMLTVLAGITAAFFYASAFIHPAIGQILFPIASIPLFMTAFTTNRGDSVLALAGAGVFLAFIGVIGVLPSGSLIGALLSFMLMIALPVLAVGYFYSTALPLQENGETKWVPAEAAVLLLTFIGLSLFVLAALLSNVLMGQSLHDVFYDTTLPFAEKVSEHIKNINPNLPAEVTHPQIIAANITQQLPAFMVILFTLSQFANLLFAQWILFSRGLIVQPMPKLHCLYFSPLFSAGFILSGAIYMTLSNSDAGNNYLFYFTPILAAFIIPLVIQGFSTVHRFLRKRLARFGLFGVYLILVFGLLVMPVPLGLTFVAIGMGNQFIMVNKKSADD